MNLKLNISTAAGLCTLGLLYFCQIPLIHAEIRPERVYLADAKKTKAYIRDGLIVGGDRAIDDVIVKEIRRATNPAGFERIVIDLEKNQNGEAAELKRPPYFQFAVSPEERRLVVTLWGKPRLNFNPKKVLAAFKRSTVIQNVVLLPRVEDNSWTFVFELKSNAPVEVFELSQPVRIIVDIERTKESKTVAKNNVRKKSVKASKEAEPVIDVEKEEETVE